MDTIERGPQLSFAGIPTFFRAPAIEFSDLRTGMVAIVGAPLDATTAWHQGAQEAPRAIREASLHVQYWLASSYESELIDLESEVIFRPPAEGVIVDLGDFNTYPSQISKSAESYRSGTREIVAAGALPIILGGDHYISFPCCQGLADALAERNAKVGYVQFGCELGLGTDNPTWGADWNGSQVRRLVDSGVVAPANVAWVGPSGLVARDQYEWARNQGGTLFTANEARQMGVAEATRRALDGALRGCESVYVSLGMDVLDSSHAPGTGAAVIGGLTPTELGQALAVLAAERRIGAFDVVEVAPKLDPSGRIQRLASNYILDFIGPRAMQ